MLFPNNFLEISEKYQYFIFDIWGVLHDGSELYPNVAVTLEYLKKKNKNICLLSNAPRRSHKAESVLQNFNINKGDLYDFILTSGEATYNFLASNQESGYKQFASKYLYIGPQKDIDLLDGLNYQITNDENEAGFVLVTGFDHEDSTIDEKMDEINRSIKAGLTMICVNPDKIVVKKSGKSQLCAGVIAKKYEELGGKVIYFGKPYQNVYNEVFRLFSIDSHNLNQVLAIGDGLETDIKGANNNNISSIFLTSGIISVILGNKYSELPNRDQLQYQFELHDSFPDYVIPNL